jgi:hypothetical protein
LPEQSSKRTPNLIRWFKRFTKGWCICLQYNVMLGWSPPVGPTTNWAGPTTNWAFDSCSDRERPAQYKTGGPPSRSAINRR